MSYNVMNVDCVFVLRWYSTHCICEEERVRVFRPCMDRETRYCKYKTRVCPCLSIASIGNHPGQARDLLNI